MEWIRKDAAVIVTPRADASSASEHAAIAQYGVASVTASAIAASGARVLSLPEAYFALAVDQCLVVPTGEHALRAAWQDFARASPCFTRHFVVFYHFRRLGWSVRPGLNYGAHFVLYRGDRDAFHSEYIVYVHDSASAASWHTVQALTRIADDAKKTVVLCEVHEDAPEARSDGDNLSDDLETSPPQPPQMKTRGQYRFHDVEYALDAVLIRSWDAATVDAAQESYAFAPQPILYKTRRYKTGKVPAKMRRGDGTVRDGG